jgi:hypothetical protein
MRRFCALLCALCFGLGCATDGSEWDEVKKDLRGDNMKMMADRSSSAPVTRDSP